MANKQFGVIGIGRFGASLAVTLSEHGHDVLCIDIEEDRVQSIADQVTHAVQADSTNEDAMRQLGLSNFDVVVVSIGKDVQASILTTLILRELGVKQVVVKATNQLQGKVLTKVGADRVVYPERDMGVKVAESLMSSKIIDLIDLSPEYRIAEVILPDSMNGKTLRELNLPKTHGISVIAIRRGTDLMPTEADRVVESNDILAVFGKNKAIERLSRM